jgi:hypothetical protein
MGAFKYDVCAPIVIAALATFAATGYAAEKIDRQDMPSVVISVFENDHPTAIETEYLTMEEQGLREYKIIGMIDMKTMNVVYKPDGTVVRTTEEITADLLPGGVQNTIKSNYPGEQIKTAEKVTMVDNTLYKVELIKKDNSTHKILFDGNGYIMPEKAEEEMPMMVP